jgi:hypothetical protein
VAEIKSGYHIGYRSRTHFFMPKDGLYAAGGQGRPERRCPRMGCMPREARDGRSGDARIYGENSAYSIEIDSTAAFLRFPI